MKVFDLLKNDVTKIIAWAKSKEPEFITATQKAAVFTTAAIAYVKSPEGVAVTDFVAAKFPGATDM